MCDTLHHLCYYRLKSISQISFSLHQFFTIDLILLREMSVCVDEPLEAVLELRFWVRGVDAEKTSPERSLDKSEETVDQ